MVGNTNGRDVLGNTNGRLVSKEGVLHHVCFTNLSKAFGGHWIVGAAYKNKLKSRTLDLNFEHGL